MEEKIKTTQIEVPVIGGAKPVFVAVVCVGEDGKAAIAFNAVEGVNVISVGKALQEFGADLESRGTKALEGVAEA